MALPVNNPLTEWNLDVHLKDVTTSGTELAKCYVPAPFRGRIVRVYAVQAAGMSGTANSITTAINGTTVSGCTFTTVTTTGLAGFVYGPLTPTDKAVTHFNEGDVISFASSGASADQTIVSSFQAIVRRV